MATKLTKAITDEILPYLVYLAETRRVTTYKELAERTGRHARNFSRPLGYIRGEICAPRGLPLLTALVVTQTTGLPGEAFLPEGRDALSDEEYELEFIRFRDEVFAFDGWQQLLADLGLDPIRISDDEMEGLAATHREIRERQAEGTEAEIARQALMRFAADNPAALYVLTNDPPKWNHRFADGERCDLLFEVPWPHSIHLVAVCHGQPGELVEAIGNLQRCKARLLAERGEDVADRVHLRVVAFAIPETIRDYAEARDVRCTVISRDRVLGGA